MEFYKLIFTNANRKRGAHTYVIIVIDRGDHFSELKTIVYTVISIIIIIFKNMFLCLTLRRQIFLSGFSIFLLLLRFLFTLLIFPQKNI